MNWCKSWTPDGTWHCKFSKSIMLYSYYFCSTFNSSLKCQKEFSGEPHEALKLLVECGFWVPQPLWSSGGVCFPVLAFVVDRWAIDSWATCDLVVLWMTGLYYPSRIFVFFLPLIDVTNPVVLCHPWPVPSWSISSFSLCCLSFTMAALSLPFPVKLSAPLKSFRKL